MGIAIFLASVILVFKSYGYDVDTTNGEVIQKGLVFVGSQPDGMDIYLNDGLLSDRTSARLHLPSGLYNLQLKKTGYRTWEKSFELDGGSVKRFSYPVLFPEQIKTDIIANLANQPSIFSTSPDRKWLLLDIPSAPFSFTVFDIEDKQITSKNITLPSGIITSSNQPGSIKVVEWSNDNRHVLLLRTYDGGREYYLLDREQPALSANITRTFNTTADDIRLIDKRSDRFYLLTTANGTLQSADIRGGASQPILTNVQSYKSYSDSIIMYASTVIQNELSVTQIALLDNGTKYILHEYENTGPFFLDVSRFGNRWYYVVGNAVDNRVLIFIDPVEKLKADTSNKVAKPDTFIPIQGVQHVSFSANTRFISAQSGRKIGIYDSELREKYSLDLEEGATINSFTQWMDGHRFAYILNGKVVVVEFDGKNKQSLVGAVKDLQPAFDTNYKTLYTIVPTQTTAVQIQRAELTIVK